MKTNSEIFEILKNASEVSTLVLTASSKYKNIYASAKDKILIQVWNSDTNLMTHEAFENIPSLKVYLKKEVYQNLTL